MKKTFEFSSVFQRMDAFIQQQMTALRTPGISIALFDRERCWRVATYGCTDLGTNASIRADTLFEIGSITKTFTAVAVLQAVEAGLLDLRTPVTTYLPWFQVPAAYMPAAYNSAAYQPITIQHLLNHSAGLGALIDQSPDIHSAVWMLRECELAWPPGERFLYSDAGYQVLALVLEAVTGRSIAQIIQRQIFDPLGMTESSPMQVHAIRPRMAKGYTSLYDDRPPHHSHPLVEAPWCEVSSGDCGIASTAGDMAKFGQMLLNRGQGATGRLLTEGSFEQMIQNPLAVDWAHCEYGYGLEIHTFDGIRHLGHGGGMPGYQARLFTDLENGLGVVMLSSNPSATIFTWKLMSLWRAAYLGRSLEAIDLTIPNPLQVENAAEYEGEYRSGEKFIQLAAEGDRLVLYSGDQRVELEKRGEDAFYAALPEFDRFLLCFGREPANGEDKRAVVEAWYGVDWYINSRYSGPLTFDIPKEWRAYPGHYRAHIPWETNNFRILLRKGALWLVYPEGDEEPLLPQVDGSFHLGEEPSPERIRFDQFIQGKAHCAILSGTPYYRFFTE